MRKIRKPRHGSNPPATTYRYFDKIKLRTAERPSEDLLALLRDNASSVTVRRGHPIRGSDLSFSVIIVAPNDAALRLISALPWLVNEVELARDTVVQDEGTAEALHALFDKHFVHKWHGKHETRWITNQETGKRTTVSGQRRNGLRFVWYSDRPCKLTGEWPCFHLEARLMGSEAVRRFGIRSPADLLNYDHHAFWQDRLQLSRIDLERLGRMYLNRVENRRRQQPRYIQRRRFIYDVDRRVGGFLKRILCQHPQQELSSVQWLIDRIGRGPFLKPFNVGDAY